MRLPLTSLQQVEGWVPHSDENEKSKFPTWFSPTPWKGDLVTSWWEWKPQLLTQHSDTSLAEGDVGSSATFQPGQCESSFLNWSLLTVLGVGPQIFSLWCLFAVFCLVTFSLSWSIVRRQQGFFLSVPIIAGSSSTQSWIYEAQSKPSRLTSVSFLGTQSLSLVCLLPSKFQSLIFVL